ncbi:hypothetical protein Pmani_039722, partial [Petrolisthes manimaculis]
TEGGSCGCGDDYNVPLPTHRRQQSTSEENQRGQMAEARLASDTPGHLLPTNTTTKTESSGVSISRESTRAISVCCNTTWPIHHATPTNTTLLTSTISSVSQKMEGSTTTSIPLTQS